MMEAEKKIVVVDKRNYPAYTMLYNEELFHPTIKNMPDRTLRVWLVLNSHCNKVDGPYSENRGFWVSYARLEAATGRSRATVARAIRELKDCGLVTTQLTQGVSYITLHSPCRNETELMAKLCQGGVNRDPGGLVQGDTPEIPSGETQTSSLITSSVTSVSGSPAVGSLDSDTLKKRAWDELDETLEGRSTLVELLEVSKIGYQDQEIWLGDSCKARMKGKTLVLTYPNDIYVEFVSAEYRSELEDVIKEKWGVRYKVKVVTPKVSPISLRKQAAELARE